MRYILAFLLAVTAASSFAQSQLKHRYLEAGVLIGLTNYSGDFTEFPIVIAETRLGSGVFARYHLSSRLAVNAQLYTGNIGGSDKNAQSADLKARSMAFKTNLFSFALITEWNVFNIKPVQRNGIRNFRVVPYIYLGIGGVVMHPKAYYYGPQEEFDRHVRYALPEKGLSETALIIPVGGGLRSQITDRITIGVEAGWRPVFSDNLDGISLNGSPKYNDWFYNGLASLAFAF